MAFNTEKFKTTRFDDRAASVPVPGLQAFFDEGAAAEWKVRGLSGVERGLIAQRVEGRRDMSKIVQGIAGALLTGRVDEARAKSLSDSVREALGLNDNLSQDQAFRIELLIAGSVDPKVDEEIAFNLAKNCPREFDAITAKIDRLTNMGRTPGESIVSGDGPKSETR